jgi:hypothetical protein
MRPLLFFVLLVVPFSLTAQNRTNIWELGYSFASGFKSELQYSNGIMDTTSVLRPMQFFDTNACISDTSGNLLFYSNGLTIGNRNYDTLQNAGNFNPGWATDFNEPQGLSTCQGVLFLPDPGSDERYYVFHETGEGFFAHGANQVQPLHLSYSVIDLTLDNGLGGIIDTLKNKYVIEDTLMWGGLTAVKHANGRDWWVIAHQFWTDKYYKLLLTPQGLLGPYEQDIGSDSINDVVVEATFSPDGSQYILTTKDGWFDYIQFDRCTGDFSNAVSIYTSDSVDHYFYGSSFSPNGRFIYASSTHHLYQYDTWNSNMVDNAILLASWDTFSNPVYNIPVLFFMHQIAPDGKIYISPFNGVEYLNLINSPDSLGFACDFTPHSFKINYDCYTFNIPSFPNYDLGALENSPCDTIVNIPTGLHPLNSSSFRISPNPATTWLNIVYETSADGLFELFDINGKRVAATSLYHYFKNRLIDVSNLPAGVYLATVTQNERQVWKEKAVIVH